MASETLDAGVCARRAANESSDFDSSVEAMNDLRFSVHTRASAQRDCASETVSDSMDS